MKMGRNTTQSTMHHLQTKKKKSLKLKERLSCQKTAKSSVAYHNQGRIAEHKGPEMTPGPTTYVVSHAHDMASTFYLFIIPAIENIILDMTNMEGFLKYGDSCD